MKVLKYNLCSFINFGTEEDPVVSKVIVEKVMDWNEANEEIAKREAYNGEYTIEDDGRPEPAATPSEAERIAELEAALEMLLSGVTE